MQSTTPDNKAIALTQRPEQTWTDVAIEIGIAAFLTFIALVALEVKELIENKGDIGRVMLDSTFLQLVQEGDEIGPYTVNSGYGDRFHPIRERWIKHNGVDLPTESGTKLFAPVDAQVECSGSASDKAGYGLLATIKPNNSAYPELRAAHLKFCKPGSFRETQPFAMTGNSGLSTGPHLHWEQRDRATGQPVHPQRGWLWQTIMLPRLGEPNAYASGDPVERLYHAIAIQESGGDPSQINVDTAATGLTQIIPENIEPRRGGKVVPGGWDAEILGRDVSMEELQRSPDLQRQISMGKLRQYWDKEIKKAHGNEPLAARRVAAAWYSGDADLHQSTASQDIGANQYPSIAEYADSIESKFLGAP